ncbi:MAG: tRNA 2-thiouridine(34) synthase MnmA [Magnetococcus sp. YQC-9]
MTSIPSSDPLPPTSTPPGRAAVALSGGVDSATTAALLLSQGWEVIGLTMQLWDHGHCLPSGQGRTCCAPEDVQDARRVAQTLGIPFYVLDLEADFRAAVVEDFLSAYAAGRTPNPCIRCNQLLKFRLLLDKAQALGAGFLATGHYARIEQVGGVPWLRRSMDAKKDQSYFLFATRIEDLARIRFPLGDLTKGQTRALAERFGLHLAEKRESMDVCFVPDGDYPAFFKRMGCEAACTPGPIVDRAGRQLGTHSGLGHYTVGQRHGLGIAVGYPLHVLAIEAPFNRIVVGPAEALLSDRLEVDGIHWLDPRPLEGALPVSAQIRHATPAVPALLEPLEGGSVRVVFETPRRGIAPGQACVFYVGDRVLGGGWIR